MRIRNYRVFGTDLCGIVVGTHPTTDLDTFGLALGSPVLGMVNPLVRGSAARYLAMRAQDCVALPPSTNPLQIAGIAAAGISAWKAFSARNPEWWGGKRVLLNGASGGVGSLLLQLLVGSGAMVSALSSPARFEQLQKLGAFECLDYGKTLDGRHWDALIDCHGSFIGAHLSATIQGGGLYIPVSIPNQKIVAVFFAMLAAKIRHGIGSRFVLAIPSRTILTKLVQKINDGTLVAIVDSVYPAAEIALAVTKSVRGHASGKIVVQMNQID